MKFYTYCTARGSKIIHRYWEDGNHYDEVIDSFPIDLYSPSSNGAYTSLDGVTLNKRTYESINEAKNAIRRNEGIEGAELYGQTDFVYQFLRHTYDEVDLPKDKFRIFSFDIETEFNNGFPNIDDPEDPVTAIAIKCFGQPNSILLSTVEGYQPPDGVVYVHCANEAEVLLNFIKEFALYSPHIITGWNSDLFDIPYLFNRIVKVLGESFLERLSPFRGIYGSTIKKVVVNRETNEYTYDVLGVTRYDYIDLIKKFHGETLESYTLDFVAETLLGRNKIDYRAEGYTDLMDLWRRNPKLYLDYNVRDVVLVEELDQAMKYIDLALVIVSLARCQFSDVFGQVRLWDCIIYNELSDHDIPIPPRKHTKGSGTFEGGYVKDPQKGLHRWVVSFDLTSLYPSLMMMYNISMETLVRTGSQIEEESLLTLSYDNTLAKDNNWSMCASGCYFDNKQEGILPSLVRRVFDLRKATKRKMIEKEKELVLLEKEGITEAQRQQLKSEIAVLDTKQLALKINANSVYGALGNEFFRYYQVELAQSITSNGRIAIQYIERRLNVYLNKLFRTEGVDYVIAIDTDSVYLGLDSFVERIAQGNKDIDKGKVVDALSMFCERKLKPYIDAEYLKLAEYMGARSNRLDMKREAIADAAIWRAKKNYIMQVWDKEGVRYDSPKMKATGIEIKRSSSPMVAREALTQAISIILNGEPKELIEFVDQARSKYLSLPLKEIASPRGVKDIEKWIDGSGNPKSGTPIHVKAALAYNAYIKRKNLNGLTEIRSGDKIRFLPLKKQNPFNSNVFGFIDYYPPELEKYADRHQQFVKTFEHPIKTFTNLIEGWSTDQLCDLMSFFE